MKVTTIGFAAMVLALCMLARAQNTRDGAEPLSVLLTEAATNNSQVALADHAWRAATHVADQVKTLPDPKITVQQFSVGSPKPFAGYTNSDFAYIGIGAFQELPYPGKLRLRGAVAEREADARQREIGVMEETVADAVKTDYLQLSYLQQALSILQQNQSVLDTLIQAATAHYRVGQGTQQEVLQAQIERTKLIREVSMRRQEAGTTEARLKALLHRDQGSADIFAEDLNESPLRLTSDELFKLVGQRNPEVQQSSAMEQKRDAELASAKRDGKPDFEFGYMYQNTDRKYRDYYMLTFNVRFPRAKRVHAEIAEAAEMDAQSRSALDAQMQQQKAAVQQAYVEAQSDTELLKEYRDGLLPQADAVYRSTLSSYATNREPFSLVLLSFLDVLNLRLELARTLADHEIALAHIESLTGATLR